MKYNVLLIEDSPEIFTLVKQSLSAIANVMWSDNLKKADAILKESKIDLILLDVELPDGNGIEWCSNIQTIDKYIKIPVILLTAHGELSDKVLGFSAGADDYIVKPFVPLELKARVEARIKKQEILSQSSHQLKWREIEIDKNKQEVKVMCQSGLQPVSLTNIEFKILMYLAHRPEHVIPRDDLLNEVWGENIHIYPRSVDTHVSKLRKKLGESSSIIESVHGVGYKFKPTY